MVPYDPTMLMRAVAGANGPGSGERLNDLEHDEQWLPQHNQARLKRSIGSAALVLAEKQA
jgi:hypothetical protein